MTHDMAERIFIADISTHTPLAGRDFWGLCRWIYPHSISTHTPLAGRDEMELPDGHFAVLFLLTRPLRDVTLIPYLFFRYATFLLTRPLRDVTMPMLSEFDPDAYFYSHAPCGT